MSNPLNEYEVNRVSFQFTHEGLTMSQHPQPTVTITARTRSIVFHPDAHALNPRLANIQRLACELYAKRDNGAWILDAHGRHVNFDPSMTDEQCAMVLVAIAPTITRGVGKLNREPEQDYPTIHIDLTDVIEPYIVVSDGAITRKVDPLTLRAPERGEESK